VLLFFEKNLSNANRLLVAKLRSVEIEERRKEMFPMRGALCDFRL
jgi:hypothetical protein